MFMMIFYRVHTVVPSGSLSESSLMKAMIEF